MTLATIGHGALAPERFAALLEAAGVTLLVDVRRYPTSRRHPQFNGAAMRDWLADAGIGYRWEEDLGGRRDAPEGAPDPGLSEPFQGYAAHMRTAAFAAALDRVLAAERETAVCCAEGDWRRCHRRLLADAATALHGVAVRHLDHEGGAEPHALTASLRVAGDRLFYDRQAERPLPGM